MDKLEMDKFWKMLEVKISESGKNFNADKYIGWETEHAGHAVESWEITNEDKEAWLSTPSNVSFLFKEGLAERGDNLKHKVTVKDLVKYEYECECTKVYHVNMWEPIRMFLANYCQSECPQCRFNSHNRREEEREVEKMRKAANKETMRNILSGKRSDFKSDDLKQALSKLDLK